MLHEFITLNRDDIVSRTRDRVRTRPWPSVSGRELEDGVPLFLAQLSDALKLSPADDSLRTAIGSSATLHGADLVGAGFHVAQVVHDYGAICQTVTEMAAEQEAPITVEEFRTLNRCLDIAIAEAVTEHARLTAQKRAAEEVERLGQAAHELRDLLNGALLAFHALKTGSVAINGSTGAVLGRSLAGLRAVVDRTLSQVRLAGAARQRQRLSVMAFVDEIAAAGMLHSEDRRVGLVVEAVDPALAIDGDPQLLSSAVMNLLHNGFKNTRAGGRVILRAHAEGDQLVVEVEDECGGLAVAT